MNGTFKTLEVWYDCQSDKYDRLRKLIVKQRVECQPVNSETVACVYFVNMLYTSIRLPEMG